MNDNGPNGPNGPNERHAGAHAGAVNPPTLRHLQKIACAYVRKHPAHRSPSVMLREIFHAIVNRDAARVGELALARAASTESCED